MELGSYIKEKRIEQDLSIRKLAELADISHTEIKRIEDGIRKQPSPQVIRAISAALHAPYEEMMAAAGYIDRSSSEGTSVSGLTDTNDLTNEEIAEVNQFIAFIKSRKQ